MANAALALMNLVDENSANKDAIREAGGIDPLITGSVEEPVMLAFLAKHRKIISILNDI